MDPSRSFLNFVNNGEDQRTERGRSRRRTDRTPQRTQSTDSGNSLSAHRVQMQRSLLRRNDGVDEKLFVRRTRSQTTYFDVAAEIHRDVELEYIKELNSIQRLMIPTLIWKWIEPAEDDEYEYEPLRDCEDMRLLHLLPASNRNDMIGCGFSRHIATTGHLRFMSFLFVEDTPEFYENKDSLILMNGLCMYVSSSMEEMLKSVRRGDSTVLLFNKSICIGAEYLVLELPTTNINADDLEQNIRGLCNRRRKREPRRSLGAVLTWDDSKSQLVRDKLPFDPTDIVLRHGFVELAWDHEFHDRQDKPPIMAQRGSHFRNRWYMIDDYPNLQDSVGESIRKSQSQESFCGHIESRRKWRQPPPSERPTRRSRSEQRDIEAIGWRAKALDLDKLCDGSSYMIQPHETFLWQRELRPNRNFHTYVHDDIDYDREFVLALLLGHRGKPESIIRCGLVRLRWEARPPYTFIGNSMAFNPEARTLIQINGQFASIPQSLEVCLRSLRHPKNDLFIFAWPLCVPPSRLLDLSWVDAMLRTLTSTRPDRTVDALRHLANLPREELDRLTEASSDTSILHNRQRVLNRSGWIQASKEGPETPLRSGHPNFPELRLTKDRDLILDEQMKVDVVPFKDCDHRTGRLYRRAVASTYSFGSVYSPLDPVIQEIRLVAVMPASADDPSKLEVLIRSAEPWRNYIALSYCWGGSGEEKVICVNGQDFKVTKNLYDFLIFFREERVVSPILGKFFLWIDALSINQNDRREKAREVRGMKDIYTAAESVWVWLGKSAGDLPYDLSSLSWTENRLELKQATDHIVSNPYVFRAWCTQELVVNGRIHICMGTHLLSWETLSEVALGLLVDWWEERSQRTKLEGSNIPDEDVHEVWLRQSGSISARFFVIWKIRQMISSGSLPTLLTLLAATQHCDSTFASDRLYSLWAIASDAKEMVPDIDYFKGADQVFAEFTHKWIAKYGRLDILTFAGCNRGKPSWIPDWTFQRRSWPLLAPSGVSMEGGLGNVEEQALYDASKGAPDGAYHLSFNEKPRLVAAGIVVDTIAFRFPEFLGLPDLFDWKNLFRDLMVAIGSLFGAGDVEGSLEDANADLLDAIVAGKHHDETGTKATVHLGVERPSNKIVVHHLEGGNVEKTEEFNHPGSMWSLHVLLVTAGRQLVVTHNGHVGLVPKDAFVGDEVAIIFGCCVPLVLARYDRDDQDVAREIIGEGYFRRMMSTLR